jgi:hypothetical protein
LVREKIDSLAGEITAWEEVTLSTDFGSHSSVGSAAFGRGVTGSSLGISRTP